jgi:hypothetical protein
MEKVEMLKPYKKILRLIALCASIMMLSACISDFFTPNYPEINGATVSPSSGFARDTQFTFSASSEFIDAYEMVLMLWSPNIDNEWGWLEIEMSHVSNNTYQITKGVEDYSSAYKYKYALRNVKTGQIVSTTKEYLGPRLVINANDDKAPEVLRTYPENLSVGVNPTQTVQWIFDEVVDPSSVSAANIMLSDVNNIPAEIHAYQNRVTVKFSQPFAQSSVFSQTASQYTATITDVRDLNGNAMQPYSLTFSINSPLLQTYALESRKYGGHCLTVLDIKKRFADPQAWNPVVEITQCSNDPEALAQRWLLEKTPGTGYGQIRWAFNYEYCLTKKTASDPVIQRCNNTLSEQRFSMNARSDYFLIESQHGGCVAAGIVDIGGKNKVESSLCTLILERNHWYVHAKQQQELSKPFYLGKYDVRFADIQYSNPEKGVSLSKAETRELVMYLYQTTALNQQQMSDELALIDGDTKGQGFQTSNPYFPRYSGNDIPLPKVRAVMRDGVEITNPESYANTQEGYYLSANGVQYYQQEKVSRWFSDITHGQAVASEVCAVKFTDDTHYSMRTFASKNAALLEGWTITHQYHCGTCSTLKDLAVYMGVKDQTTPIRLCTKRGKANNDNLDEVKQCIQESVGFTSMCAESWAYNGMHTGQECKDTCMKTYGNDAVFWPKVRAFFTMVIAEKFNACPAEVESSDPVFREQMKQSGCPLANENTGKLNDCLWCDEKTSGPGFKYSAARTRRGSGLPSAIPRPNDKLFYEANHSLYFQ